MARLTIITGPLRKQSFELDSKDWLKIIGRTKEAADFLIPDPSVSRRHAELSFRDGQWILRDLNSSNGTFLNERRVTHPTQLRNQDQIRCGGTVLLYESAEPAARTPADEEAQDRTIELVFDPGETMVAVAFTSLQSKESAARQRRMIEAGQAAMNLSHGIKNILQALRTGIDVMDQSFRRQDLEQARKSWGILRRNFLHIEKFVLDLLKFSKEDKPDLQPCQFNRLAETAVQMVRPQAMERSITLTANLDERIGQVQADPDRMQDVLVNLLLNAIEAAPPQTGQVTLTTEQDEPTGRLLVRVQDNGPGIENTETLFRPFHTTKGKMGTGLGLAIAKKVVTAHGGTIDAQTILGEGTVFTVAIPMGGADRSPDRP
jgi:signal transduction histidine kinase